MDGDEEKDDLDPVELSSAESSDIILESKDTNCRICKKGNLL